MRSERRYQNESQGLSNAPAVLGFLCCCCLVALVVSDSFVIPWTVAHQALLSMGFFREEHWSVPPPRDLG